MENIDWVEFGKQPLLDTKITKKQILEAVLNEDDPHHEDAKNYLHYKMQEVTGFQGLQGKELIEEILRRGGDGPD